MDCRPDSLPHQDIAAPAKRWEWLDASTSPKQTIETVANLKRHGFPEEEFRRLHHLGDSMTNFVNYLHTIPEFADRGGNPGTATRLRYVEQHRGEADWSVLVDRALLRFPI